MSEFLMLLGMAAVTFGVRYILLAVADQFSMPDLMERALYYVPPAVLTAILVPAVLMPSGTMDLGIQNAYLFGGIAAVLGGLLYRKNTLMASIVTGLLVFFAWRFFLA